MFNKRLKRTSALLITFALSINCAIAEVPQVVLQDVELDYRAGKVDAAIAATKELLRSAEEQQARGHLPEAVYDTRRIKADLAVFQLKAGHADESARLIRELLLELQMAAPMISGYSMNPADFYSESPDTVKDYFKRILEQLGEGAETKAIVDSLVDNTVPKNYSQRLKAYCNQVQDALKQLGDIHEVTDGEQLKYGDPLSSLDEDRQNKSDQRLSKARLDKVGSKLDELATEAQQLPVGDARPALLLYRVALAANSAGRYEQAESFAQKSIAHIGALTERVSGLQDVEIALAFAYVKLGKKDEFRALKDELIKNYDGRERVLITLARFTEATGDGAGALEIYNICVDNRKKNGDTQKPEWFESYDALLKSEGEKPESPKHDMFQQDTSTRQ